MHQNSIEIWGEEFEIDTDYFSFSFQYDNVYDMNELQKLATFPQLEGASFSASNFNDIGIKNIARYAPNITNLNLQDTQISDNGLKYLSRLKGLEILRLKGNTQLTNKCIPALNLLKNLEDLQLHGTSIDQNGFKDLQLPHLKFLLLNNGDKDVLLALSKQLPLCEILVKGKIGLLNGKVQWERS